MTDAETARELGIPGAHGCTCAAAATRPTTGIVSDRVNYCTSPAIRTRRRSRRWRRRASTIDDIDAFDLYSCFPCAVQIGADMLGVRDRRSAPAHRHRRPALPRRPGQQLQHPRRSPAWSSGCAPRRARRGLVTGLGWYLTKHAVGVYSSAPPAHAVRSARIPTRYQHVVDAEPHPELAVAGDGAGDGRDVHRAARPRRQPVARHRRRAPRRRTPLLGEHHRSRRPARASSSEEFIGAAGQVRHHDVDAGRTCSSRRSKDEGDDKDDGQRKTGWSRRRFVFEPSAARR